MPASAMARASLRFLTMPATFSVSTTTRPSDLAIAVVAFPAVSGSDMRG